jgi:hypothetical protein
MKRLALTLLAFALVAAVATSTASAKRLKSHAARHSVQVHTATAAPGSHALRRAHRGLI